MAAPSITAFPEKIINTFLSKWNAASLPIQYTITNDKFPVGEVVTNYFTQVLININGVLVATIKQIPDSNNETKIDVRKYAQTALKLLRSGTTRDTNASCEIFITGSEEYIDASSVQQSNAITGGGAGVIHYGTLSALPFGGTRGGNMYDYIMDRNKADLGKFMTFFTRGQLVDTTDYLISFILNEPGYDFEVKQYDINAVLLATQLVSIADEGVGVYRIDLDDIDFEGDIDYLSIEILTDTYGTSVSEIFNVDADFACIDQPAAPSNLTASAVLDRIDLAWTSNSAGDETGFLVRRGTSPGDLSTLVTLGVGVTSYQDTAITEGVQYFYTVLATGELNSAPSNEANATALISFSMQWKTDNAGASTDFQITLPSTSNGTYDYDVLWGDGESDSINTFDDAARIHTYAVKDTYTVKIFGVFKSIYVADDPLKLLSISNWGILVLGIGNTNVSNENFHFLFCANLVITADGSLDMSETTQLGSSFNGCTSLTSFPLIDTSAIVSFRSSWNGCSGLTSFPLLDMSSSNNTSFTWKACSSLTSFPLIDFSSVTGSAADAWLNCTGLTSFPLVDLSSVDNLERTWQGCTSLTSFPAVDMGACIKFNDTWQGCTSIVTFSATLMSAGTGWTRTWQSCSSMTSMSVAVMGGTVLTLTWNGCSSLVSFPLINFSSFVTFSRTWKSCSGLTSFPLINASSAVNISESWSGCSGLTSFPLLVLTAVTNGKLAWNSCSSLTAFPAVALTAATDLDSAWEGCSGLTAFPALVLNAATKFLDTWRSCTAMVVDAFLVVQMRAMTAGQNCFDAYDIGTGSYDAILIDLDNNNPNAGVPFTNGTTAKFTKAPSAAATARASLITNGWTITDGGPTP